MSPKNPKNNRQDFIYSMSVVTLDFDELEKGIDLSDKIATAFGADGLGILTGDSFALAQGIVSF